MANDPHWFEKRLDRRRKAEVEIASTYIDEQGRTITVCPPRYAAGALVQGNFRIRQGKRKLVE